MNTFTFVDPLWRNWLSVGLPVLIPVACLFFKPKPEPFNLQTDKLYRDTGGILVLYFISRVLTVLLGTVFATSSFGPTMKLYGIEDTGYKFGLQVLLIVLFLVLLWKNRIPLSAYFTFNSGKAMMYGVKVAGIIAVVHGIVMFIVLRYFTDPGTNLEMLVLIAPGPWYVKMLRVPTLVVFGPLVESLIYVGLLYPMLRRRLGVRWAMTVTTFLWWLGHSPSNVLFLYLFLLGLVFVWVYEKTRSIWSSVLCHVTMNYVGLMCWMVINKTV